LHVIYWDIQNNQVHLNRSAGAWSSENLVDTSGARTVAGSAAAYLHQNVLHVVSRGGTDGHLIDMTSPAGAVPTLDLTAAAHNHPPAATYRPSSYTPAGAAARIVFRGLKGPIWQIERDTLVATDLTTAAGAPLAAGSPSALFLGATHILYRALDNSIQEIFDDSGTWKTRSVCNGAAADPSAYIDERGQAAVSFLADTGTIRVARLVNGTWQCENTSPGALPPPFDSDLPGMPV
jgi:hypothetical protein